MDKSILIAIIIGGVNLVVGLLFFLSSVRREESLKTVKKVIKRFFVSSHQVLLVFTVLGAIIFALSKVGALSGCSFILGVLSMFCFEKILMRFGRDDGKISREINMAAGVSVIGFILLLLSALSIFSIDLILALPYLLGVALSMFFFEIYSKVFAKSAEHVISGIAETTGVFAKQGKSIEIMLITVLIAMIVGSQSISGAIIPIVFLALSAIIFLTYLFAWKIVKNSSSEIIKNSLFWFASTGLIAGSFFVIKIMGMPLSIFWPFATGIALAFALYVSTKKLQAMVKFAIFTGSLYLASALVLKFGGTYSLAIFVMGFVMLTFMSVFFLKDTSESLLDGAVVLTSVILLMLFLERFNMFSIDLSIGRVMFGLMSGVATAVAISIVLKAVLKKGMEKTKEELPRTQNGNYKKLVQKIAGVSVEGSIATLILAPAIPLTILAIAGVQSFIAFTVGLAMSAFPFLLADDDAGREILSVVFLLCILSIVLMI
ncbi:hypothetical protein D4R87_02835 [bacterium]|nr:MAG: hypothetical protein D4R87_02835 [bacterium]